MLILKYIKDLTNVFFRWWWAALTAVATFVPLFSLPPSITVSKTIIALALFGISLLLFLTLAVMSRGFRWYIGSHNSPTVNSCVSAASGTAKPVGDEVLQVSSIHELETGQILTVLRTTNRGTGCFGIVKVDRRLGTDSAKYQCSPLWIAPVHKNDLVLNQVQPSQLSTSLFVNYNDLVTYLSETQNI